MKLVRELTETYGNLVTPVLRKSEATAATHEAGRGGEGRDI